MNKYQLALNKIKALKIKPNDDPYMVCQLVEFIDVMQELIDNYTKLEKALDKACELLELNSMKRTDAHVYMSKTKWKGWLLNDK